MTETLLNPFEKYTETRLLMLGIAMYAIGSLCGYYFSTSFYGVIDLAFPAIVQLQDSFIENGINTLSLFLLLYVVAKIINSKTRAVDILNTALVARIPFYFLTLFNCTGFLSSLTTTADPNNPMSINFSTLELVLLVLFSFVVIAFLIWFVVLLFNGFKTASNSKKPMHKLYFALAIIAAEILSKFLLSTIN